MEPLNAIADNFIYGAPELAVWGWALLSILQTRHSPTPEDATLRRAMVTLILLSFAMPLLYAITFQILDPQVDGNSFEVASKLLRFLRSLLQAICWYVVLKIVLRRRAHGDQGIG